MAGKLGLGLLETLLENLDRDLNLANTTLTGPSLKDAAVLGAAVQTVAAAGGDQAAATAIAATAPLVLVTGADSSKGVKLPSLATAGTGAIVFITNVTAGQTLKVYPATGDQILPLSDNAHFVMAASTTAVLVSADGDKWIGLEGAVIAA
tara:strand:+ start:1337 stop:1786 length:450 start_codon:yes stop_codon:yes gene_type:complete